jgi:thiamine-phosphate pyrophosphorylase
MATMASASFHVQMVSGRLRPIERSLPVIKAALEAGIDSVQLRDEPPAIAAALRALKASGNWDDARLVVNGDPKTAGSMAIRWLHLPSSWLEGTPPFARFARVGISVHSLEDAIEAEALGADYVTFGNVFTTPTHPGRPAQGLSILADIVDRLAIPVLAIGGITHANVTEVLATSCAGVAVRSALTEHPDPGHATRRLLEIVRSASGTPRIALQSIKPASRKGTSA